MPYLKLDQTPLYYEQRGPQQPGRPLVVFFNGWCLSARYWEETAARLEKDWPLLLFDSRGFGRSRQTGRGNQAHYSATIEASAQEAGQILAQLGRGENYQYHVVGHSLGAVTAAHFATLAEQRGQLASLTIVNSGSFGPDEPQGSGLTGFVRLFVRLKGWFNLPLVRSAVVSRSVALPVPAHYERVITEDFSQAEERTALELALSSLETTNLVRYRKELERLSARLLLVVGDRDPTIPPKGMYNIARFKPEAILVALPDCGHLPMLERPARFAEALNAHFEAAQVAARL